MRIKVAVLAKGGGGGVKLIFEVMYLPHEMY